MSKKYWLTFLFSVCCFGAVSLFSLGQIEEDASMVNTSLAAEASTSTLPPGEAEDTPSRFFTVEAYYDAIGSSRFTTPEDAGQKIFYGQGDYTLSHTRFITDWEGLSGSFSYNTCYIGWKQNPFFSRHYFQYLTFTLGGFSKRFNNWEWRGSLGGSLDTEDLFNRDYALLNYLFWGRYKWENRFCEDLGLHIGFVGRSGLKQNQIFPILGIDFKMTPSWKLNLVYPLNLSAVYTLNYGWSLAVTGKIWNTRHRVAKNEVLSKGIFEYRNTGGEISLNYACGKMMTANVHAGSTLGGGDLKVMNRRGQPQLYNKFKAAAYVGGGFSFNF